MSVRKRITISLLIAGGLLLLYAGFFGGLILIFFGSVPAVAIARIIFAPSERALIRIGRTKWANYVVPLVGFLLPLLSLIFLRIIVVGWNRGLAELASFSEGWNAPFTWGVLGAGWGAVWRFSELVEHRLRTDL